VALALGALAQTPPLTRSTTMHHYLSELGVLLEDHYVTTTDGYILHLHRLPRRGGPVVFLQHGVLASSWCWLSLSTANDSVALSLYNRGYDVWMGNSRGNDFSANHTSLNATLSSQFWNFTFDEMARYDDASSVAYVGEATQRKLTFVGWSQGTTAFFIAATATGSAAQRTLARHVNLFVALSPVTYLYHTTSTLLDVLSRLGVGALVHELFPYGFLRGSQPLHAAEELLCRATLGALCKITVDMLCGTSSLDQASEIERFATHFPAGTSVKDLDHYEQWIDSAVFQRYDYGRRGNEREYGSSTPPAYNLSAITPQVPIALFAGQEDALVALADFALLQAALPAGAAVFTHIYEGFSHLTWFAGGASSRAAWMGDLSTLLARYNPVESR